MFNRRVRRVDEPRAGVLRYGRRYTQEGIESQLATSVLALSPVPLPQTADRHFRTTEEFWRDVLLERARARRTVTLHDVFLSEWFPRSPGLYYTELGRLARSRARKYIMPLTEEQRAIYESSHPPDPVVYDVYDLPRLDPAVYTLPGKEQMLRGGIGCIRLNRRLTTEGPLWFMSASTTLFADQGVPLAVTDADYERHIDEITERGVVRCTVTGKLMVLPDSLLSLYRDYTGVPRLYVLVEELTPADTTIDLKKRPTVSVAVMFTADDPWSRLRQRVNAAYVSFAPGRHGDLVLRLQWLDYYVACLNRGAVITDFDEQMTRFPNAVFSLEKVMNGSLRRSELTSIADTLGVGSQEIDELLSRQRQMSLIHIEVGEVHVGDTFKHIGAGAVVVNRSTLQNALNRVENDHGPDVAQAVRELADAVARTGNPDAVDNLNGLTEELERPDPRKNRLKTWLDAIVSALPGVTQVAEAAARLSQLLP